MIHKTELLGQIARLLDLARARDTNQGVNVYEEALKRVGEASSQREIEEYSEKLMRALAGIEAHGHYTNEEFEVVKAIRSLTGG